MCAHGACGTNNDNKMATLASVSMSRYSTELRKFIRDIDYNEIDGLCFCHEVMSAAIQDLKIVDDVYVPVKAIDMTYEQLEIVVHRSIKMAHSMKTESYDGVNDIAFFVIWLGWWRHKHDDANHWAIKYYLASLVACV
jgi:hypothetical protein